MKGYRQFKVSKVLLPICYHILFSNSSMHLVFSVQIFGVSSPYNSNPINCLKNITPTKNYRASGVLQRANNTQIIKGKKKIWLQPLSSRSLVTLSNWLISLRNFKLIPVTFFLSIIISHFLIHLHSLNFSLLQFHLLLKFHVFFHLIFLLLSF